MPGHLPVGPQQLSLPAADLTDSWLGLRCPTRFELLLSSDVQALIFGGLGSSQASARTGIVQRAAGAPLGQVTIGVPSSVTFATLAPHHRFTFLGPWGQHFYVTFSVLALRGTQGFRTSLLQMCHFGL